MNASFKVSRFFSPRKPLPSRTSISVSSSRFHTPSITSHPSLPPSKHKGPEPRFPPTPLIVARAQNASVSVDAPRCKAQPPHLSMQAFQVPKYLCISGSKAPSDRRGGTFGHAPPLTLENKNPIFCAQITFLFAMHLAVGKAEFLSRSCTCKSLDTIPTIPSSSATLQ